MARINRDAYGIPHLWADSVGELAHTQGLVTAQDRVWQLEYQRRRATGTTAEVLGRPALAWDRLARRTRIADTARRALDSLQPETRAFVASYVGGVNAGLESCGDSGSEELTRLGIVAEPWQDWTPIGVFLAQHLLFGSFAGKLWGHHARNVLGDDAWLLSHEGPLTSGSNAWAVGGARTASGLPLIGGDPHRNFESPGVYQQVRLACPEFDVVGFTFPGVPGVQHFAHAGDVAWAITNAAADYQDVYAERLRRSDAGIEVLGPGGWEVIDSHTEEIGVRGAAPEPVEVIKTDRGSVFHGGPDEGEGLSLRAASTVLGDAGFDALLPLLRARTTNDVDAALDRWVEPVNNVVIADRAGTVRYRVAGRIPQRADGNRLGIVDAVDPSTAWSGWLGSLPRTEVSADGQVVTANERRGSESEPIGTVFAPPYRADRLHALLEDRDDLGPDDFARFHNDTALTTAPDFQDLVRGLSPGPAGARVRDAIVDWDGRMDASSTGAAAFASWRTALARRVAAEPVFAPLADHDHELVLDPWFDVTGRIGLALENLIAVDRPFGIDLRSLATAALDDAADHAATWGDTHVVSAIHAFDVADPDLEPPSIPALPVDGDTDCVRCTGSLPAVTDDAYRGSVARYVWDLADPAAGGWVVPLGAAGDPGHPHHHDQLPHWVAGELVPIVADWDQLTEQQD